MLPHGWPGETDFLQRGLAVNSYSPSIQVPMFDSAFGQHPGLMSTSVGGFGMVWQCPTPILGYQQRASIQRPSQPGSGHAGRACWSQDNAELEGTAVPAAAVSQHSNLCVMAVATTSLRAGRDSLPRGKGYINCNDPTVM